MPRIIETPKEWQIKCPHCGALIGYTKADAREDEHDRGDWHMSIKCPACQKSIEVPYRESDRTEIKTP